MSGALDTRRLFRESLPIAAVLLFWTLLSIVADWLPLDAFGPGIRLAGVVMAALYAVVSGVKLANTVAAPSAPADLTDVFRENVRVAVAASGWFLLGFLVYVIRWFWTRLLLPGVFTAPAAPLASAFVGAGVGTVLLYAIAVGLPRVRNGTPTSGASAHPSVSADD